MASKQASHLSDSTGLSNLAQLPPKISLNSPLLAFEIALPSRPAVSCSTYKALNPSDQLHDLETARRKLVLDNRTLPITKSLLPSIRVARDSGPPVLYVFAIHSLDQTSQGRPANTSIRLDRLSCSETVQFCPEWLYACSAECSVQAEPCSSCLNSGQADHSTSSWSSACLLPREPLRRPYAQFIHALRNRLIEDISQASAITPTSAGSRQAVRYKRGFLLGPPQATSGEWSAGWDYHTHQRALVYCELSLHLYSTRILVHPVMRATPLLPLRMTSTVSSNPGTPIILLPYGVPAYYLNTYTGHVGSLTRQFDVALLGLGVGNWKILFTRPDTQPPPQRSMYNATQASSSPTYVVAWLAIQNKHGDDKGMPIVWPASLCMVPLPSFVHSRPPLKSLPVLPAQLLASPPAAATLAPPIRLPLSSLSPANMFSDEPVSPRTAPLAGQLSPTTVAPEYTLPGTQDVNTVETPRPLRPFLLSRASTSDSLRAFRSLTIANESAKGVAGEVSAYVDAVAKEREKERERLKRERDGGGSLRSHSHSGSFKQSDKAGTIIASQTASISPRKVVKGELPISKQESDEASLFAPVDAGFSAPAGPSLDPIKHVKDDEGSTQTITVLPVVDVRSLSGATAMHVDLNPLKAESEPSHNAQTTSADTSSASFDPFSSFDSNWHQPSGDFMGINLDHYDMGLAYSLNINGAGASGNGAGTFNMDDGFGVFTDDDFNFFDGPSTATRTSAPLLPLPSVTAPAPLGRSTPVEVHDSQTSGPGPPPPALSQIQPMPWANQSLVDGYTPKSFDASTPNFPPPPDLMPSTPTQSPSSHSAPVTPSVMLSDQLQLVHIRRTSISSTGSNTFDPIPFAQSHKAADGKYALGKFALPTPPAEGDICVPIVTARLPLSRLASFSWQSSYNAATDPRVGIVRRLAGAKRKRLGTDQDGRDSRQSPFWVREHEEWAIDAVPEQTDSDGEELKSDSDPDNEDDEEAVEEDQSMSSNSRGHTPPPAFLPVGPTLVQTQFQHGLLLPLSVPLRHADSDIDVTMGMSAPMSAPTPVSPAAILGAPSERSKALEGAAQVLVKEVVENCIWGDCWRSSVVAALGSTKHGEDVWSGDIRATGRLIASVEGLQSALDIGRTFSSDALIELHAPFFTLVKSEGVVQVSPPALRFWEKLGLCPRAGLKNVTAYIFYEGSSEEKEVEMADWLDKLSAVYSAKNFGCHTRGRAAGCTRDGLVPIQFEAFRKTFVSFVAGLPQPDVPTILYIVTPARIMNLASSHLRQVLSAIRKVRKTYPDAPILAHLVPESLVSGTLHEPGVQHGGLEIVADTIYDRALVPVERTTSRWLYPEGIKARAFAEPAYALASSAPKKVTFSLDVHPRSLDVFDRHYMLHVGYRTSDCGKWLFAACIDQRGEAHDLKSWLIAEDSPEHFIVTSVWDFIINIANKANVEWRVVISRLGVIGVVETDAWISRLDSAMQENQHLPPLHISLLVAEYEDSWTFIAPDEGPVQKTPTSPNRVPKHSAGLVFADTSCATYILHPKEPIIISTPHQQLQESTFIPDTEDEGCPCEVHIRPILTTALIRVPAGTDYAPIAMLRLNLLYSVHSVHSSHIVPDVDTLDEATRNYYDLSVLTRCRWKPNAHPILPFHLAALEVMSLALSRSDVVVE